MAANDMLQGMIVVTAEARVTTAAEHEAARQAAAEAEAEEKDNDR